MRSFGKCPTGELEDDCVWVCEWVCVCVHAWVNYIKACSVAKQVSERPSKAAAAAALVHMCADALVSNATAHTDTAGRSRDQQMYGATHMCMRVCVCVWRLDGKYCCWQAAGASWQQHRGGGRAIHTSCFSWVSQQRRPLPWRLRLSVVVRGGGWVEGGGGGWLVA